MALLYEGLVQLAPTVGALVGRAAAVAEARNAGTGLDLLQSLPEAAVKNCQPFWAVLAHLLGRLGRTEQANLAYRRAIGLCDDAAMRAFLIARADGLNAPRSRSAS